MLSKTIVNNSYHPPALPELSTLVDLLQGRASRLPGKTGYTFLADGEEAETNLTYGELDERARAIAVMLKSVGATGQRVLLLYPSGVDYIAAFFGCLYAGAVAVPAYPPRLNRNLLRLQTIVADAQATVALTTVPILTRIEPLFEKTPELRGLRWLNTDRLDLKLSEEWEKPSLGSETLAFLQYTSGSTSVAKGVMVSHGNLLHNERMIARAFEQTEDSITVGWLPLYHDMGLIGNVLQPLYTGTPCILMSPMAFLQRPFRWLQAISRYRATTSGGPNFAYDLCVNKINAEQRELLDLSSWSVAYNGSEPVRAETLERFAATFEPSGFRREAFLPCYGLAEATLLVSGAQKTNAPLFKTFQTEALERNRAVAASFSEDANLRTLVGCGKPPAEQQVVIVDPETLAACEPGNVGEVWVAGPNVTHGYWNRPDETEHVFHARLAKTNEGRFLRTGDLGFIEEGQLFVTGRLKDLIIIRGLNHYPQDIEFTVESCHPSLRPGGGAAFSVEVNGDERLVVVQEVNHRQRPDLPLVLETIRQAIADEHEVQVHSLVLVKAGEIPKTSSGKIQRGACRARFLAGSLDALITWQASAEADVQAYAEQLLSTAPSTQNVEAVQLWLQEQFAARLGVAVSQINVHQPIAYYGLDSLLAIEMMHSIETQLGVSIPVSNFLRSPSIFELAGQAQAAETFSSRDIRIQERETATAYPLSQGQQSLWFMHELAPESAAYNIARAVRFSSTLDVDALHRAFQKLVDRHASLRTTFTSLHGGPVQLVHEAMPVCFTAEDVSVWGDEVLSARLNEEANRPFNLEQGNLLRVKIFSRSSREHVLLLVVHHIVADFWSLAVLMQELSELYSAEQSGIAATLPPLARQYTDYVSWQEDMLASPEGESRCDYWLKHLAGEIPLLDLPTDRPRPTIQTYHGAVQRFRLSTELTRRLKALAHSHDATLYMTLLAAYQVLLYRHSGQHELIVGSPTTGRSRAEFTGVMGYFVNPVAMRASLSDEETFSALLGEVRRNVLSAFEHQDCPFLHLVERLQLARDPARSTLFQTMFSLQKAPFLDEQGLTSLAMSEDGAPLQWAGQFMEVVGLEQQTAQFDLTLMMAETAEGFTASFEYDTDLFDASTISRLAAHYQTLLTSIVNNPQQRVSELEMLSEGELHEQLVQWNKTETSYPQETCLHELFEQQVERSPDALALTFEGEHLTYAELNARANQLAHYLQEQGIGVEDRVGVLVQRSVEMVVALLGVLKAGAAYVPLDPQYPQSRLTFMLADANIKALLTQQSLLHSLPEHQARTVCLDTDWPLIAQQSVLPVNNLAVVDNLAYTIYTSGSTGLPKGVQVAHRQLVNFICSMQERPGLQPHDRLLAVTTLCFDIAALELYLPLCTGAQVIVCAREAAMDGMELRRLMQQHEVTVMQATPASWRMLIESGWSGSAGLKVLCGGEALAQELAERLRSRCAELWNMYGPTETTVWSAVAEVGVDVKRVVLGEGIANTELYIVDERMKVVPIGVSGELYIGGEGVARGYLNRPELTAERFVPHPFSASEGARLYRTGDMVRRLSDGQIEFLGRADQQVKIRGFRIELGEIESVLCQHSQIREAVVIVQEMTKGEGQKRLVGYLVTEDGEELIHSELRQHLGEKLPEYMIPSVFVSLSELPLTPNGKVDRRALPAPDASRLSQENAFVAPRTPIEAQLCAIWQQVLGLEQVGIHDNFFSLGGDSILSIQIVARANQAGLSLSPRLLFQHQTVAALAGVAGSAQEVRAEQGRVSGRVPLTPIQHWFFEQVEVERSQWNQSVLLESRHGEIERGALGEAVREVMEHHDALRMKFRESVEGWEQECVEIAGEPIPLTIVDLTTLQAAAQENAGEIDEAMLRDRIESAANQAQRSLSLSNGELLRVVLFECGQGQPPRLLIVIHHLVVDGVSWRVLLEDLETAYEQVRRGERVRLPPKTTSFKEWAEELVEYAQSTGVQQQSDYWQAAAESVSRLPRDFDASPDQTLDESAASSASVLVKLDKAETRALLQEVPSVYHTEINDVLLTTLAQSLCQWSERSSVLIELEGHGREEISTELDISRTVGWFTTLYPVRLELSESRSVGEDLKAVKEQLRGVPERGLGYGLLKYVGGDEQTRQRLREVRAEVAFNYLGQLDNVVSEERMFRGAKESSGESHSRKGKRSHALIINASVQGGELVLGWSYSRKVHERETIERVAAEQVARLRQVVEHCREEESGGYTPSDFPLARLSQRQLDVVIGTERKVEDIYPLSPMQQGMLFHSLYAPEAGEYVTQFVVTLVNEVDVAAFRGAWQRMVERHSALRAGFVWEQLEKPVQVIGERVELPWEEQDWSWLSASEQEQRLAELMAEDRERGFDLRQPPLMRLTLVRLSEERHHLIWSHHHLLFDGWSLPLLLKEVFTFYEALARSEPPPLAAPRPYRDYIQWLQEQDMASAEHFWRERLRGFHSPTQLGVEGCRLSSASTDISAEQDDSSNRRRHNEQRVSLSEEATQQLQSLARRHQLTLNTVVQGAWALLLSRYSGSHDVVFGATVSGRPAELSGVEQMLGLFINTLPMRVEVKGSETVAECLRRIQAEVAETKQYEYAPLFEVQRWSEVERGQSLFDSILVFENYPVDASVREQAASKMGLEIARVQSDERTNYGLSVMVVPGQQLTIRLGYETSRYEDGVVERMLGHLARLLESMASDPQQHISELEMLSEAERQQLLVEFNDTRCEYPQNICLHQLFEQQVERTPDALALTFEDQHLTYAELNRRANQLAHYLQSQGIGVEDRVGVLLERSVEMVVSLLAILKAGAAYVPLDPAYPHERLAFTLADSTAALLISRSSLIDSLALSLSLPDSLPLLSLDLSDAEIAAHSRDNLSASVMAENLAYLIYTSGSTGTPKGVAITHHSASTLIHWSADIYSPSQLSGVLASTSICFDLSVWELFVPLALGGRVLLAHNALELPTLAARDEVRLINTVPSAMAELVRQRAIPRSVEVINLAGEALSERLVKEIYEQSAEVEVNNLYGPSEDTTYSTWQRVRLGERVTIGRPVANTQVYILGEGQELVGVGVRGEVYIGGEGLARGYLNQPGMTAERFIPHPFSQRGGARLYKTGDVARYLADGEIEYLGRIDHQVKIRGFRIELGEIESVLCQHEQVREAVVVAQETMGGGGQQRLVAYVVAEGVEELSTSELSTSEMRQHLGEKLPEHMIPSVFVQLTELPLTPNGKVDRRALPSPDISQQRGTDGFVAPRTPIEEQLCAIWQQVLGLEQVGIHDNFFELGGHSLLATQVMSRLREAFQVDLPLRTVFEAPTVAALAERVTKQRSTADALEVLPLKRVRRGEEMPLSFAQQRLWFVNELEPGGSVYNIPVAFRLKGRVDCAAMEQSLRAMVMRHESLRTSFQIIRQQPVQVIQTLPNFHLPIVNLEGLPEDERERVALQVAHVDADLPFDLTQSPLLRVLLVKLSEDSYVFLLTMHHIISDGWSIWVFVKELAQLYKAFAGGESSPLPPLKIQYADFAHWQRQWFNSEMLEMQLAYWKKQLADAPPVLELPVDYPRPNIQSFRGKTHSFALSEELFASLKVLSQRENATLYMTLLACFKVLLYSYTGQNKITVGSPIAGRNRTEVENLIGFFVNMLPLSTNLAGAPTFQELLSRVREVTLEAYHHQDVPFEKLVEELQPERSLSHSPIFQVAFVLQNTPTDIPQLPEVTLSLLEINRTTAKFDLTLSMMETTDGVNASFEYSTDLFEAATIERLAIHFQTLLESVVADPQQRVSELEMLSEAERHQLLVEFNDTSALYPQGLCLHQLFEQQVERTPDALALTFEDQHLTYAELNGRANQLAHYLQSHGIGVEDRVGVLLERSIEMVVALLAILKAGAAYVPLDPAYPQERLAFTLADSTAALLLSRSSLLDSLALSLPDSLPVLALDRSDAEIASHSNDNLCSPVLCENLAYLIYTSGSTGTPKGVAITHHSAATLIHWSADIYSPSQLSGVLASTSICFDLSVWELFVPLALGGRVLLAHNALELPTLAAREEVRLINTVPSAMAELVRQRAIPRSVEVINLAGEALSERLVKEIYEQSGEVEVNNLYGPSEDTTYSTWQRVRVGERVTIGRPVANTQVYILDGEMKPVGVGVRGEVYIGGEGLARGYLNQPGMTAERFIPHPFSTTPGARLYRTGDVGRYRADGEIEYLGRTDHQVKVRGFRIELGEIESVLCQHEQVREAVVVAQEATAGQQRLVAYVVAEDGAELSTSELSTSALRQHLGEKLPEHMIPSVFVQLAELPLTPNGKVDRRALPAPDASRPELLHQFVAARTAAERVVSEVWAKVLGRTQVGIYDNFFELGGHSLIATQVISHLREIFDVELSLRSLFETPTVDCLISVMSQAGGGREAIEAIAQTFLEIEQLSEEEVKIMLLN